MIDPQKCVEALLLNAPSENAVPLVDLLTRLAEIEPGLKSNGEYLQALRVARSVLDYDQQESCDGQGYQAVCCQNSTLNN